MAKIAIIGNGYLGKAYHKVFPDAVVYDEPQMLCMVEGELIGEEYEVETLGGNVVDRVKAWDVELAREQVNNCDMAIVAVPTDPSSDGSLDMSIVEDVVGWLETPLILIKSALMPGIVDRLVESTGKKIAVSVEMIGMGKYYIPPHKYPDPDDPQKHSSLIIGGELETATRCAEILWDKMSPDIRIHLLSAREAELCKLIENAYGAMKVTFVNCMYSLVEKSGQNFIRTHQAWSSDGRVDGVHLRTISSKRGWKSHCWDKDINAMVKASSDVGAEDMAELFKTVVKLNQEHLAQNDT